MFETQVRGGTAAGGQNSHPRRSRKQEILLYQKLEVHKKICSTTEMPGKGREENGREAALFVRNSTSPTQPWPVGGQKGQSSIGVL